MIERIAVGLLGAVLAATGIACAIDPAFLADPARIAVDPAAAPELRAMYGGVQGGFGLFCLWSALAAGRMHSALVAISLVFLGIGLCRLGGLIVSDGWTGYHGAALGFELVTGALAGWRALASR